MQNSQKIFALDIGTRSVVGIILEEISDSFQVTDILVEEHKERAMLDGQIHDVPAVAEVISTIKEKLEEKHGPLHKVCVAAAGRALKTETSFASLDIKGKPLLKKDDILHLELSAVQQAQAKAAENQHDTKSYHYYCVGYSVLFHRLDGEEIGSLIDQQGDEASVEIIATFLPRVVVESLIAALNRSGLEMEALTLEPIAAINVLIPPSMRRLNVALVDIGAGTSDIALTNMGTVTAYGMVPTAGDEITEAISDSLLLDFPLAEKAKRELHTSDEITVTDILGFENQLPSSDVVEQISPAIHHLAEEIAKEILRLNNQKPPQAVMLVGGGSLTPSLPKRLASALQLPENRVAVRGVDAIQNLTFADSISKGPELVTPIGIAIAAKQAPVQYISVQVNDQPIRLFEVKDLTIGDCILAAGLRMSKLYGKPGNALFIKVNDQEITLPGEHGNPPIIMKNGQPSSLDETISNNDILFVEKGADGRSPSVTVGDLLDSASKTITVNEKTYTLSPPLYKNGRKTTTDEIIEDGDSISMESNENLVDVLHQLGYMDWLESWKPFRITIDGKETFIPPFGGKIFINGKEARSTSRIQHNDCISFQSPIKPTVKELLLKKQLNLETSIHIRFNGTSVELRKEKSKVIRNGNHLSPEDLLYSGDSIFIEEKEVSSFIFQDLFKHVEIDMPSNFKGSFVLLKNGEDTTFYDPIQTGDELEIVWPESS
ncbi:cell division protein FtsA [Rossellomorea aquimaris]|uniref:cell division protein FtsA n=1 Tax=Rossellomorea aquimaris TaxID=189382 RepID=UPI000B24AF51|nr:cell division protein FtsA [Rossellomorea aquimaris]